MWDWCAGVVRRVWEDEEAASLVEYVLIVFLIAMVCVGAAAFLGRRARFGFSDVARVIQRGG